ncbi:MAG: energy-coupling factor transporter ATPase [Clostridiales bacterium]|nr:energy-coupling factor transporter ATPase [Clostridiales bacterium]
MKDSIIEFDNVSFTYDGTEEEQKERLPAVKEVTLSIKKGEFVSVLGHNGSGKSTLAKLCNAILIPQSGKVTVCGMDTADESLIYDIREKVGMVFQNPDNQIVATIVEDDVAFGPENLGVEPKEIRRRVDESLKAVGMYEFREYEPHKLSGGQKQRVAIAGIIAMRTDCIVFDEPTAMIDPKGRAEVMETAKKLNRENGITVIFITHFMEEAAEADRVVVMDDGRVLLDGTPARVFGERETIRKIGLEIPSAANLADMLKENGIELESDVLTPSDCIDAVYEAARKAGVCS